MPTYKAKSKGFYNGKVYDPNGKRPKLRTEKPLKKVPSWLEQVEDAKPAKDTKPKSEGSEGLSPQQKAAQTRKANAEKKKAEADVSFTEESSSESSVETL